MPYRFGFGVNEEKPTEIDLTETFAFVALCGELGIKVLNTSAGSPYSSLNNSSPAAAPSRNPMAIARFISTTAPGVIPRKSS